MSTRPRVLWLAGTRGEVHRLAPLYREIRRADQNSGPIHWFALLGEQGMAAYQAVDTWELRLDDEFELRHPAEDPALRLNRVMTDVETLVRQHRADRLIVAGCGPSAAAAALVAHARNVQCIWLKPYDPHGLISRLRWERGLVSILDSLDSNVTGIECSPTSREAAAEPEGTTSEIQEETLPGRRPDKPLVQIAVGRRQWIIDRSLDAILRVAVQWARDYPEVDWMLHRTLVARMEGVLGAVDDLPVNLLGAAPVPLPIYESRLDQTDLLITDSYNIAAESRLRSIPAVLLCEEKEAGGEPLDAPLLYVEPKELSSVQVEEFIKRAIGPAIGPSIGQGEANEPPVRPASRGSRATAIGSPVASLWAPDPGAVEKILRFIA